MEEITLPVEPKRWQFCVSRQRQLARGPREVETMARWAERWHRRSRDTRTREVRIEWSENVTDDFIRNLSRYLITVWRIVDGQERGLPPVLLTDTQALVMEAVDGQYFDRAAFWEGHAAT